MSFARFARIARRSASSLGPALALLLLLLQGCHSPHLRRPAGPVEAGPGRSLCTAGPLRVGVGRRDITPPPGIPLAGYGGGGRRETFPVLFGAGVFGRLSLSARQSLADTFEQDSWYLRGAEGAHDAIEARAFAILPGDGPPLVFCRLDLVIMTAKLQDRVLELTRELGLGPDNLLLSATHTHSGPGAYHTEKFARLIAMDNFRPEVFEGLARGAADAIRDAITSAAPATLAPVRSVDKLGREGVARNRRASYMDGVEPDDRDPEILALVARARTEADAPGPILGVLLNFAVHPTVLGMDNDYFSKDIVLGLEGALEDALPGRPPVVFVNGAEGDIGPNNENVEPRAGLLATRRLGERLAACIAPAIKASGGYRQGSLAGATAARDFGSPLVFFAAGDRRDYLEACSSPAGWWTFPLTLPVNLPLWILGVFDAGVQLGWNLQPGVTADLSAYGESFRFRLGAARLRLSDPLSAKPETPRSRELLFVAVPGEATHDVGRDLKQRGASRGADTTFVLGLTNDALSYIASEREYYRGGYEAMATLFGPETAALMTEALESCFARVFEGAAPKPTTPEGENDALPSKPPSRSADSAAPKKDAAPPRSPR